VKLAPGSARWYRAVGTGHINATPWAAGGVACMGLWFAWTNPAAPSFGLDLPEALAIVLRTPLYGGALAAIAFVWFAVTARVLGSPTSMRRIFEAVMAAWVAPTLLRLVSIGGLTAASTQSRFARTLLHESSDGIVMATHLWLVVATGIALGQAGRLPLPRVIAVMLCPFVLMLLAMALVPAIAHAG